MTPKKKLLLAIFGQKASDGRATSLRLPPGVAGTVVEVRVFNRHGIDKDERAMAIEREEIDRLAKDREDERAILNRATFNRLQEMLLGQVAAAAPKGIKKGVEIDEALLAEVERHEWRSEEHTSELQSLMRNSYAVFCLKKKKKNTT